MASSFFSGKESCDVVFDKKKEQYVLVDGIEKAISYIVDKRIRDIVREKLNEAFPDGETYRTEAEKALAEGKLYNGKERSLKALDQLKHLSEHPLYTDKNKSITIKSVRCFTGLNAVQPLRYNSQGKPIAFVLPKNNHHVAIYANEKGEFKECIYTFWQAVERAKYRIPLIIENPQTLWTEIARRENEGERFTDSFIETLPSPNWTFVESIQQNDMFIMDMDDDDFNRNVSTGNYQKLGQHLYRVQRISAGDYVFRLHTDTTSKIAPDVALSKRCIRIKSFKAYFTHNPHKVRISLLGKIL